MKHGKPQKQALAIAYSTKRANMSKGGKAGYDKDYANISSDTGGSNPNMGGKLGSRDCPDCMAMGGCCSAHEGYAEGGEVDAMKPLHTKPVESSEDASNEDLHPEHGGGTPMVDPGVSSETYSGMEEDLPKLSEALSLAAEVMKDRSRRKMAKGGSVQSYEGEDTESSQVGDDETPTPSPNGMYETKDQDEMDSPKVSNRMNESRGVETAQPHVMSDNEHDSSNPSEDDLVSQILQDRKKRRKGM